MHRICDSALCVNRHCPSAGKSLHRRASQVRNSYVYMKTNGLASPCIVLLIFTVITGSGSTTYIIRIYTLKIGGAVARTMDWTCVEFVYLCYKLVVVFIAC